MSRAVLADHAMFIEAVEAFRPKSAPAFSLPIPRRSEVCLLSTFHISKAHKTGRFILEPTQQLSIGPTVRAAILQPVKIVGQLSMPNDAHNIGQAIAAILTACSGRSVISPRDPQYQDFSDLSGSEKIAIAIEGSFVAAGPGSVTTRHPEATQLKWLENLDCLSNALLDSEYERYEKLMYAIHLYQLAITLKRTDFDLAYSLLIASIEAAATMTIGRNVKNASDMVKYSAQELKILEYCNSADDPELKEWFRTSIKQRGALEARFLKYLLGNISPQTWDAIRHPHQDTVDMLKTHGSDASNLVRKSFWDKYPEDLEQSEIEKIFRDTYKYRSGFIHEGRPTPFTQPVSYSRYFDTITIHNDSSYEERLLITFDALASLAQTSLFSTLENQK